MIVKTTYCCEVCKKEYENSGLATACEAHHRAENAASVTEGTEADAAENIISMVVNAFVAKHGRPPRINASTTSVNANKKFWNDVQSALQHLFQ